MGRWLDALKKRENAPDRNLQNPQNPLNRGFEGFESVNSTGLQKNSRSASNDQRLPVEVREEAEQLPPKQPEQKAQRRVIPFPGREWKPDTTIRPDDPERYADALRIHGPASYGMMMRILGWGGTRAGRAEDELRKQGRVAFDRCGFAFLIDQKGGTNA